MTAPDPATPLELDVVAACSDLADRSGATEFEVGYVPATTYTGRDRWYAHVRFNGVRIIAQDHDDPETAAYALARRLLRGAMCKCTKPVALRVARPNVCLWTLVGQKWTPGCDVPAIQVDGERGDTAAMIAAMDKRVRGEA